MSQKMNSRPNRKPLLGALVVILSAAVAVVLSYFAHSTPFQGSPSFDVTWQRGVTESTERFQTEIARIGGDASASDEARGAAMIAAQDRHAVEMNALNKSRMEAVESFQRQAVLKPLFAVLVCAAALILWLLLRRPSSHVNAA